MDAQSLMTPATAEEARALTDRIKQAAHDFEQLVWEAHQRRVWRVLGERLRAGGVQDGPRTFVSTHSVRRNEGAHRPIVAVAKCVLTHEQEMEHRRAKTDPTEGNARLIAAAPNMLAVCHAVLAALSYPRGSEAQIRCLEEVGQDARAAIAKAEGKQP